jgi:uncharacterized protein (TIGR01777 family)
MSQRILITGGTGLVGTRLTELLVARGYLVVHVSRTARAGAVPTYAWNVAAGTFDEGALAGVTTVVHLAGAGVADERWTAARKKEILDSRVQSTQLLARVLAHHPQVTTVVAASAIGYYGFGTTQEWLREESPAGSDFLADVTQKWEAVVDELKVPRLAKLRIGIVLSTHGGALKEIAKPVRLGVGAPLGDGHQWMSWIHIDDLCAMFIHAIENDHVRGTYNAVGPQPATNREMTNAIAQVLHKPLWLPPVPGFALRLLVGEMAAMVLNGSRVSPAKIEETGFRFQYPELKPALKNLFGGKSQ